MSELCLAYDLPAEEYALGPLRLRPYSMAAHRRAGMMSLVTSSVGLEVAREHLSPAVLRRELDALYWLLSAPLPAVRSAFVAGGAAAAWGEVEKQSLPHGAVALFAGHLAMILGLCRDALFEPVDRDLPEGSRGPMDEDPPEDLMLPTTEASLVTSLCDRIGVDEERLMEWIPFPRILQYSHAVQFANPYVWTVRPRAMQPDPYGDEVLPDPGYGEAVAF